MAPKKVKIRTTFTDAVASPRNGLVSPAPTKPKFGKSKK